MAVGLSFRPGRFPVNLGITSLWTSLNAGIEAGMGEMRKITVHVPRGTAGESPNPDGEGVTQTVTAGLKRLASIQAQQELLKLRGKIKFSIDLDELREDRTWSQSTRHR